MNSQKMLIEIKKALNAEIEPEFAKGVRGYFRETISPLGVRLSKVRPIANSFHSKHKHQLTLKKTLSLSEECLKTGIFEIGIFGLYLIAKNRKEYTEETFKKFEKWLKKYVDNWAWCDLLCGPEIGYCIDRFPEVKSTVFSWHKSKNRWLRRASVVSYVTIARKKDYSAQVVKTAQKLLNEKDDLVQKGCGWALREAAKKNKKLVLIFLRKNKLKMPRTTLRYAIERFTQKEKKELMRK